MSRPRGSDAVGVARWSAKLAVALVFAWLATVMLVRATSQRASTGGREGSRNFAPGALMDPQTEASTPRTGPQRPPDNSGSYPIRAMSTGLTGLWSYV